MKQIALQLCLMVGRHELAPVVLHEEYMAVTPDILGSLLNQHWGSLLAWVGPCGGAAEDVVQQAFIALSTEVEAPRNPVAWLYATSRNLAINEKTQQQSRQRRHKIAARQEHVPSSVLKTRQSQELAEKLSQMSDQDREIVVAHIWGGLSFEEIATMVQASRVTVWRRYNSALNQLRELYGAPCETKN